MSGGGGGGLSCHHCGLNIETDPSHFTHFILKSYISYNIRENSEFSVRITCWQKPFTASGLDKIIIVF